MAIRASKTRAYNFANIYLFEAGMNASKAAQILYEREGRETNGKIWRQIGYQLLHSEYTQQALDELKAENQKMFEVSRDKIITKLNDMIDDDDKPKIQLEAIDKLARIAGLYNDALEVKGNNTIEVRLSE